jgi:glucosamine--fructose-6-phosphate aminotransferase (isomerizing)
MSLMREEALESPEAVARCLAQENLFTAIGARLRALDPPFVLVIARGSSGHAGTFLRYIISRRLGLVGAPAMPSMTSIYGARQRLAGALVIAISQSGRSPDLVRQTAMAHAGGAFCLGLVNDANSPLAAECDALIDIAAGPERSVAATKTVLATMAAGLALVHAWKQTSDPALGRLPARLRQAATLDWSALAAPLSKVPGIFTVGRGAALGIAKEAALKLAETCGIAGLAFSAAEIAHGPMALAGSDFPVLAFLQHDASLAHSKQILSALAARGVPVMAAGDSVAGAVALPTLPWDCPDADLLGELLCFYLAADAAARARGLDPDHPPRLRKVTMTI